MTPEQRRHEIMSLLANGLARMRICNREQREKNGGMRASNGDFRRAMLKRTRRETAPTQGERAKKSQPDVGWDFTLWWRRRELNPRPQALYSQVYMLSLTIWF